MTEPLPGTPEFLSLAAITIEPGPSEPAAARHEVVTRRRLDTRQVVPFFHHDGVLHVGVLERWRASRLVRGADPVALEPIGFDFSGVDETSDIRDYGRAVFSARAGVDIDEDALAIALPSVARSIGYATELAMPLLLPIRPPSSAVLDVAWDGLRHRLHFRPIASVVASCRASVAAEDLTIALSALSPPPRRAFRDDDRARFDGPIRDHAWLAASVRAPSALRFERRAPLRGDELQFLRLNRVVDHGTAFEVVTPRHGVSVAILPYLIRDSEPHFLLWVETRVAAVERRVRQPIFDLPVHPRHVNATARYMQPDALTREPRALAAEILQETMQRAIRVLCAEDLGTAEPAPSFANEVRRRLSCELDPTSIGALPADVAIVSATELTRAVRDGVVRDPVIVAGLLDLGFDPFLDARRGDPALRRSFLDRMTEGSRVVRRLQSYSSIEREQLAARTYARVMLLLQHEYGVRIAYPRTESDRSFFKAAFRVFLAAPRGDEDRALQGLHWSHDAFHFALGNYTLPVTDDFDEWYLSGEKQPASLPDDHPLFAGYARALKAGEDEATFFSFWQLHEEQPSLTRYVPMLTYWRALRDMGITERSEARAIFDDVTARATIPPRVLTDPAYGGRKDIRGLFEYMRGFRDYHHKDIVAAWAHASRDVYRGFFIRFGIYETDSARYVDRVRTFMDRLEHEPPGLDPLRALAADIRVAIALRVYDVTKSLRLQRTAIARNEGDAGKQRAARRSALHLAHVHLEALEQASSRLATVRGELHDAELSSANEERFAELNALAAEVDAIRDRIWDDAAAALPSDVVTAERTRELPR